MNKILIQNCCAAVAPLPLQPIQIINLTIPKKWEIYTNNH
ncbi:hypothetical protein WN944_009330 [Citrus x changshan-huyou]|uniref:Uncharacterized protein n=1 Tax=Citrus x changshan-huyou TaxID=2935761 RepID=A0AAP0MPP4_9ROSI